jgi:hypothetical protein
MILRSWDAVDELWHSYRDPVAEGEPGALQRLLAIRDGSGWNVPLNGKIVRVEDGTDAMADAVKSLLP